MEKEIEKKCSEYCKKWNHSNKLCNTYCIDIYLKKMKEKEQKIKVYTPSGHPPSSY